ncbi:MAG: protein L [Acinetobacter sp.]|jgi:hypothetical protein|uniref:protein L n=1 Tax=Acinetobacter pittii TaxID=48296 RepID=UPI00355BDCEE
MALTTATTKQEIGIATSGVDAFSKRYSAGSEIVHSGIYKCTKCNREIAANKHQNTLPPHYQNNDCNSPEWRLYIFAQN